MALVKGDLRGHKGDKNGARIFTHDTGLSGDIIKMTTEHCWDFQNCPEEARHKCPAFIYPDEKCWNVASGYCEKSCPKSVGGGGD